MNILPTRRDELWRYSDMKALATAWPLPAAEHIIVPAGGNFVRAIVQNVAEDITAVQEIELVVGKAAQAEINVLNIGGKLGRIAIRAVLHENADFTLNAVQLGHAEQTLEIISTIIHAEPGATSRQTVRTVLAGKATGSYLGKILVAKAAQKTDATQSSKALLLSRFATANTKPELEILADDVKCAHGATVGELDKNALFYMQSRGLDEGESKSLLTRAFITAVIDNVADDVTREKMTAHSDAWLEKAML